MTVAAPATLGGAREPAELLLRDLGTSTSGLSGREVERRLVGQGDGP